jgi:hypothetical protein
MREEDEPDMWVKAIGAVPDQGPETTKAPHGRLGENSVIPGI